MMLWRFDEDRADFRPALPGEIEADPDAHYVIQRGDVLIVMLGGGNKSSQERDIANAKAMAKEINL